MAKEKDKEGPSALEAARSDALAGDHPVTLTITTSKGSAEVTVLSPMDWAYDAYGYLRSINLRGWLERAMAPEEFKRLDDLHPSYREVLDFATDWEKKAGQDLEKSGTS